jgi:hypothetical protein
MILALSSVIRNGSESLVVLVSVKTFDRELPTGNVSRIAVGVYSSTDRVRASTGVVAPALMTTLGNVFVAYGGGASTRTLYVPVGSDAVRSPVVALVESLTTTSVPNFTCTYDRRFVVGEWE